MPHYLHRCPDNCKLGDWQDCVPCTRSCVKTVTTKLKGSNKTKVVVDRGHQLCERKVLVFPDPGGKGCDVPGGESPHKDGGSTAKRFDGTVTMTSRDGRKTTIERPDGTRRTLTVNPDGSVTIGPGTAEATKTTDGETSGASQSSVEIAD